MFSAAGPVRAVRIPKKRNPKFRVGGTEPETLPMGYAFVEYASEEGVAKAMRTLQGKVLDEYALQLSVARAGAAGAGGAGGEAGGVAAKRAKTAAVNAAAEAEGSEAGGSAKLMVRNLAFEATKTELTELFGAYGAVKTVRIPKKFNGTHRGFAFIEFLTHAEAAAAKAALAATHLYGRHLVLEWAAADADTAGVGGGAGDAE